jgi:hypothetical protein
MPSTWAKLTAHWATPGHFVTMCDKDLLGDLRFRVGDTIQETQCSGCQTALVRLYADVCPELNPPTREKWELLLQLIAEGRLHDVAR